MSSTAERHWFAYRLRTLLITVFVMACVMTPVAIRVQDARQQRRIVAWVLTNGGSVQFDWETNEASSPPGPNWCRSLLGDEFFQTVRCVSLGHRVRDLTPLQGLTNLEVLSLSSTRVSDLTPLQGLTNLEVLSLSSTRVSNLTPLRGLAKLQELHLPRTLVNDLSPLQGLSSLYKIDLSYTEVSDLSPLQGLRKLQLLGLWHTPVSDLTPLQGLTNLEGLGLFCAEEVSDLSPLQRLTNLHQLDLRGTYVTDEELARLWKALPSCSIAR